MTQYAASGLETADYGAQGWQAIYNLCIRRLNNVLLNLSALLDVDVTKLKDGSILTWNSVTSKWECKEY